MPAARIFPLAMAMAVTLAGVGEGSLGGGGAGEDVAVDKDGVGRFAPGRLW